MAEDEANKEDKFDFTSEGETLGYISLEQARVLTMETARESPGHYRRFARVPMAFTVVEQEEGEDYYVVTLSFRPEGDFEGTPGQEQFFITKEGAVSHRQVLALPRPRRRSPIVPVAIGLAVIVVAAVSLNPPWLPRRPPPRPRRRPAGFLVRRGLLRSYPLSRTPRPLLQPRRCPPPPQPFPPPRSFRLRPCAPGEPKATATASLMLPRA